MPLTREQRYCTHYPAAIEIQDLFCNATEYGWIETTIAPGAVKITCDRLVAQGHR